jgi:predicted Zn-dependent protease with MMP-like domain
MVAAFRGDADERAELARIAAEHGLEAELAAAWRRVALEALRVLHDVASIWPAASRASAGRDEAGGPGGRDEAGARGGRDEAGDQGGRDGPTGAAAPAGGWGRRAAPGGVALDAPGFERLVAAVLDDLPGVLAPGLANLPLICEDEPPAAVPGGADRFAHFERGRLGQRPPGGPESPQLPAGHLVLYRGPICRACNDEAEIGEVVRRILVAALCRQLDPGRVRRREPGSG